jgi:MbtH protein
MTNPFDDEDGSFLVVVDAEGRHALWPAFAAVPEGWTQVYGEADRRSCLEYVAENWTDIRPMSLIEFESR